MTVKTGVLGVVLLVGVVALSRSFDSGHETTPLTITIDVTKGRHPINPNIYGVAYASQAVLSDLNAPVHRMGGNSTTRYNWKLNADNRGADWYFESIADTSETPGERGDTFIATSKAASAQAMLTIPMVGYVAKLGDKRAKLASFLTTRYGAQQKTDPYWPEAGNGVGKDGKELSGNNPSDANMAVNSTFQQEWVRHLVGKWGKAANGGLRYYVLDNEPAIWHGTHRDVHPNGATLEEVRDKILDYAAKIKAVDPGALVVAPEEWGWTGYLYSGYDSQWGGKHGWNNLPDRAKHGGKDALPWLLDQLHQNEKTTGKRLLDIFSVHYYPQGGEFNNGTEPEMQLRRNRSTRSLWDPNYKDESWINDKVRLIPRLKEWVSANYPGTPIGLTEYNWGAEGHINGATAQADIYGLFGREGLDIGCRWTTPDAKTPTYKAMKMYRNYDGKKSGFGDTSVACAVPNPDEVSAFAAVRSTDGALTIMVINKQLNNDAVFSISLAGFAKSGTAQVWQLTSANTINHLPDTPWRDSDLRLAVPAQSVTLFVLPK